MKTELLYLNTPEARTAKATVIEVKQIGEKIGLVVDRTNMYPQGGGQPSDVGQIFSQQGDIFNVESVRKTGSAEILHFGSFEVGKLELGDQVRIEIDVHTRMMHERLHTAGELICAAVCELGYWKWKVAGACHFPNQARVVFDTYGEDVNVDPFRDELTDKIAEMVSDNHEVNFTYVMDSQELGELCPSEAGKEFGDWPVRMVSPFPGFWRPCLGTHCASTRMIGDVELRKIRRKKGKLAVSYEVPDLRG